MRETSRVTNPRFIRKDPSSGVQGCASLTEVDGGHVVVVKRLTDTEAAAAAEYLESVGSPIAADEVAGFVPTGVIQS